MPKMFKHPMFTKYFLKWLLRIGIFLTVLYFYIFDRELVQDFINFRLFGPFTSLHVLWSILMISMITHIIPVKNITMGALKSRANTYVPPQPPYDRLELLEHVQKMNINAWKVMLVWLIFNSIFGILFLLNIIRESELIMLSLFYYVCDTTCIIIFCPFQSFIMHNRCCVNCRIFDWGHFMMYTPLLLVRSFFTWSLFFTSCVVLIRWEISYAKHPERFWRGSNCTIRCENCMDKMCQIKKPINDKLASEYDKFFSLPHRISRRK